MPDPEAMTPRQEQVLTIGVIRSSSIGDVILASSLLNLLQSLALPHKIFWFGSPPSLDILAQAYPHMKTYPIKGTKALTADDLIKQVGQLDAIIDLQKSVRTSRIAKRFQGVFGTKIFDMNKDRLTRIQMIIEARFKGRRGQMSQDFLKPRQHAYQNMLEPAYDMLKKIYGASLATKARALGAHPDLIGDEQIKTPPHMREMEFGHWIAVAPGAAHETKRMPTVLFARILQMLFKELNYHSENLRVSIVFLGDESDRKIVTEILSQFIGDHRYINLAGRLSLWESTVVLKHCRVILSNDTALAHAAEAVGTPACVMFGPTAEAFGFSPWRKESRAFSSLLGCRPCSKHGKIPCRFGDKKCFHDILLRPVVHHLCDALIAAAKPPAFAISPADTFNEALS